MAERKKKNKCPTCQGKRYINEGATLTTCPQCTTTDHFMDALTQTLYRYWSEKKWDAYYRLERVCNLLPDSSVLAVLEAEHQRLNNLVPMLKNHFGIRGFR